MSTKKMMIDLQSQLKRLRCKRLEGKTSTRCKECEKEFKEQTALTLMQCMASTKKFTISRRLHRMQRALWKATEAYKSAMSNSSTSLEPVEYAKLI